MKESVIPKLTNDSLARQLISLYETFKDKDLKNNEDINFSLSELDWACPLLILPVASYIASTNSNYLIDDDNKIKSYLETIKFPDGINSVSDFKKRIFKSKNYIPISILKREGSIERERLESIFTELIYKIVDRANVKGLKNVICHPIAELVTNIFEHSKKDEGFVFGQYYKNKNILEICIVDRGRGLANAYQQENELKLSDEEAIGEVMKGHSTKPDKERGYGVRTSKKIVCGALGGEFVILSGSAALISTKEKDRLIALPNFYWQGVVVAYRIPIPETPVDISPYLE
ncbi:MAG: hypothetical protein PHN74_00375 [Candidatus Pacebacteria bacterium]|nr:hypothetical protein [Candidatus Paceibacterota bacterium]